eukprot:615551-Alexandrium_andersonii.AAC.1
MPRICLSRVTRHTATASPSAYSCALSLGDRDGAARCCRTARAPRLSEHADASVPRVKCWRQTRRLTHAARASQS